MAEARRTTGRRALVLAITAACLLWAGSYVYEAAGDPFGGDETALFIQPLFYLLLIAGAWAGIEAFLGGRENGATASTSPDDDDVFGASGLADRRRLVLVSSFPAMLLLIAVLGFVVSAALYVAVMAFCLGERRSGALFLMALLAVAVVWLFFETLLGVPLSLWPPGFG